MRRWTEGQMLKKFSAFFFLLGLALTLLPAIAAPSQAQTAQETPETLLAQADDFYSKGDYKKAVEEYLRVISLTENRMLRSRAWMGLSLCYFFENEIESAKKAIRRLLEIEPQKEISPLFYPQTFVNLFYEAKKEIGMEESPKQPASPRAAEPARSEKVPAQEKALAPAIPVYKERKGGYLEVEVHYSGWSVDPAKGFFESSLTKKVANEVRDDVTDQLRRIYGSSLAPTTYTSKISIDSQGSNYGLGIRFYPQGYRGSFSIGLSIEKTHIRVPAEGEVTQRYADGSEATVQADASIETSPFTTNLSFRWDLAPSWRVSPYFIFGLGVGRLTGEASYEYGGTYRRGGGQLSVEGGEAKTFDDLREEGEIGLDLFILVHTALGVKGEIISGLTAKAEVGFWDGLIFRAGLAFRF